jgi:hypothetical protein
MDQGDARDLRYALVTVLVVVVLAKSADEDHVRGVAQSVSPPVEMLAGMLSLEVAHTPDAMTYSPILGNAAGVEESERVVRGFSFQHS